MCLMICNCLVEVSLVDGAVIDGWSRIFFFLFFIETSPSRLIDFLICVFFRTKEDTLDGDGVFAL